MNTIEKERLEKLKDRLQRIYTAIDIALESGVAEFSLDTGQSNQKVKNYELDDLIALEKSTLNSIERLENKCRGNIVYLRRY